MRNVGSHKTEALVNSTGHKLKVDWLDFFGGPSSSVVYSLLTHDIGACVRGRMPMRAATFKKLKKCDKDILYDYLESKYEIQQPRDPCVEAFIEDHAQTRYSSWKSKCKKHYMQWGPNQMFSEFKHRPEEWHWLVTNDFENEKQKDMCERNKANRIKNPNGINHCSGVRALCQRALDRLNQGSEAPYCESVMYAYSRCKNAEDKVASLKRCLEENTSSAPQSSEEGGTSTAGQSAPLSLDKER